MTTIAAQLDAAFRRAIFDAFGLEADPLIAVSQNESFGDYQSNAAMGLVRQISEKTGQKTNPRQIAEQIKSKLDLRPLASEISIAGPGFINVKLDPVWITTQLQSLSAEPRLGIAATAEPRIIVIDYSGPNVAKQMHIGHLRSTNIGDALARILQFHGDTILRQNHLGDWGTQFGMLLTYLNESTGRNAPIADLEDFYRSSKKHFDSEPAFADRARATVVRLQGGSADERQAWEYIVEESRRHFQPLYQRMHVTLMREHERGESFYNPFLSDVVAELKAKGVAVESEGATVVWVEGFEAPLIVQKTGGGFGYAATDLAALRYRARELHAQRIIYVTDARQIQHFRQVFDTARRAGWVEGIELHHVAFGTILGADGTPLKTRTGDLVKLADVLDEAVVRAFSIVSSKNPDLSEAQRREVADAVGIGGVKYYDLARDRTGDYVFDWDKMLATDGNTAPYLQYAHARIQSILRKSGIVGSDVSGLAMKLDSSFELAVAKHILRMPEVLELVGRELKPHYLCTYLYDLSSHFSGFYENCPVLKSDEPTRSSRLALCRLTASTLALGLGLLGIAHPEEM